MAATTAHAKIVKAAERLEQQQRSAAIARKVLAARRAAGTLNARPRSHNFVPPPDSLGGRIDAALAGKNKTRSELSKAIGISLHSIHSAFRNGTSFKPKNIQKMAKYLGVTIAWLLTGKEEPAAVLANGANGAPLAVPQASMVFRANGKHPAAAHPRGRVAATLDGNLDTAMSSLWTLLPIDVKAMVLARISELLAMSSNKPPPQ